MKNLAILFIIATQSFFLSAFDKTPPVFNHFTYPEGKYKALIMSFDDGITTDIKLVALFNQFEIIGTFNLNSNFIGTTQHWVQKNGDTLHQTYISKGQIPKIYRNHEIAVHGASHQNFKKINKQQILEEINLDLLSLSLLSKNKISSMAYPFGVTSDSIAKIVATTSLTNARTVKTTGLFDLPENLFLWNPTCRDDRTLDYLNRYLILKENKLSVFYVWGHSWELCNPQRWNNMAHFCQSVSRKKDIWYTGSGNLANYLNAIKKVVISNDEIRNPKNNISVWINLSSGITVIKPGQIIKIKSH